MSAVAMKTAETGAEGLRPFSRVHRPQLPKGGAYGLEVGERLRARREELGLKQQDVAERAGTFARVAYTNFENGNVVPGPEKIFDIARALETSAKWIYFGDDADFPNVAPISEMRFHGGRWADAGRRWGIDRQWFADAFPEMDTGQLAAVRAESDGSTVVAGDIALVDRSTKPREKVREEFVFSFAGAIYIADLVKVGDGYDIYVNEKKTSHATSHQIRILGHVIGMIAKVVE